MAQSRLQALRRGLFELSQYAVHTTDVDAWMLDRDVVGSLPVLLVQGQPGALLGRE